MCGIVAILSREGPISQPALENATAALRHRGPDGDRCWTSTDGRVGLGHTRLAVIDPDASQPIASEDGRLHIVVNGELYGFEAIRRELEGLGHRFRTRSDSEIALHLYEDLRHDCVKRLRGEFAFIVWDARDRTLFAARDRFGIKPLFYCEQGPLLVLASEAKALFAAGVAAAWNHSGLMHTLLACPQQDSTMFTDVRQVPPGHWLRARDGRVQIERYWNLPRADAAGKSLAVADAVLQTREKVEEAVRLRLTADAPVGCLLSGGLDSSTALGVAAAHSNAPVAAFTVGFEDPRFDESAAAREMVDHVSADHRLVVLSDRDMADHFGDAVWHAEMVQYNAHGTARFLLSRAVRSAGYKAVLAGEGADELFFGYEFLRAAVPRVLARAEPANPAFDLLLSKSSRHATIFGSSRSDLGAIARWIRLATRLLRPKTQLQRDLAAISPWLSRLSRFLDVSPQLLTRLGGGMAFLRSLLEPQFLRELEGHDPYRDLYALHAPELTRRDPPRQLLYLWLKTIFANYHMAADRLDMAHGVEVRLPFLDHVLFEQVSQLPLPLLTDGREKHLLREAARPYLSPGVYGRKKQPFWAPPGVSQPGSSLHALAQDTLRGPLLEALPFFRPATVIQLLDRLPNLDDAERRSADPLLMMLLSICLLGERMRSLPRLPT